MNQPNYQISNAIGTAQNQIWQYAAKLLCGIATPKDKIAPAEYWTNINVHNPWPIPIPILKKVALSAPEFSNPIPPSTRVRYEILPDFALEIDCNDIRKISGITDPNFFIKGFFVIESPRPLDVIAVYTSTIVGSAGNIPTGLTLEVVPVEPKIVSFIG